MLALENGFQVAGGDRDYHLGFCELVWVDNKWFIDYPGVLNEFDEEVFAE